MTATIFRLPGTFNNSALPIVAPLMRSGLVAAWRLYAGESSMHDLSGNGHSLRVVGSPEWTSRGVICNQNNYFESDVSDSKDVTLCLISRPILNEDGSESDSPGAGSLRTVTGPWQGFSIYNNGNTIVQNINTRLVCKTASGENQITSNTLTGNRQRPPGSGPMEYAFSSVALDSVANKTRGASPKYGSGVYYEKDWNTQSPFFTLADRSVVLSDGRDNTFAIGASPGISDNLTNKVEICEVLVYESALSFSQVETQYAYSKKFYSDVFGIDV